MAFLQGMHVIARSGLRDPRETDDLSTATKPKAYIMKSDSRSADAFGQVDLVIESADIPHLTPLTTSHNDRPAASRAAAMRAFVAGLLVAAIGARPADKPTDPGRPPSEPTRTVSACSRLRKSARWSTA